MRNTKSHGNTLYVHSGIQYLVEGISRGDVRNITQIFYRIIIVVDGPRFVHPIVA
jgi:hypothetical protein